MVNKNNLFVIIIALMALITFLTLTYRSETWTNERFIALLQVHKQRLLQVWNTDRWHKENQGNCVAGHIKNMPPFCGSGGCLSQLPAGASVNRSILMGALTRKNDIIQIEGWMHVDHFKLVNDLTEMQWTLGVYGSVGEIGVHHGLYASVLAVNTDTNAGERFFICDIFEKQSFNIDKSGNGNKEIFLKNMAKVGFQVNSTDPRRKLHIWADSSVLLKKDLFVAMNLPQFRFFSIDGSHYNAIVNFEIPEVVCALREGGIVSFDDVNNNHYGVHQAIKDFNLLFGRDVLVPLLFSPSKLYSTTAEWYPLYKEYITEHIAQRWNFTLTTTSTFGFNYTYFSRVVPK